jgi:hypothetical protein
VRAAARRFSPRFKQGGRPLPSNDLPTGGRFRRSRRVGANAAFAKAMARSEFGRFYTDQSEQRELARSLARARPASAASRAPADMPRAPSPKKAVAKRKAAIWREPRVRERRTELADARARLLSAARRRSAEEAP